jgi:hypothetical protein
MGAGPTSAPTSNAGVHGGALGRINPDGPDIGCRGASRGAETAALSLC